MGIQIIFNISNTDIRYLEYNRYVEVFCKSLPPFFKKYFTLIISITQIFQSF